MSPKINQIKNIRTGEETKLNYFNPVRNIENKTLQITLEGLHVIAKTITSTKKVLYSGLPFPTEDLVVFVLFLN